MAGLQVFFDLPVRLTPSVLAYSLLYPYSDNLLDDPALSGEEKRSFNQRFKQRIEGEATCGANTTEATIFRLVEMIEDEHPRQTLPSIWQSLIAIHQAQGESIRLLADDASPYDIDLLGIAIAKGGASVLADGYLVAGKMTLEQAQFLFDLGAFMQLADDLQDVLEDRRAGLQTIFSQVAMRWPLDAITRRTLAFGVRACQGVRHFPSTAAQPLKELLGRSLNLIVISARRNTTSPVPTGLPKKAGGAFPVPVRSAGSSTAPSGPPSTEGFPSAGQVRQSPILREITIST